ncbi:hypothetical protein OAG77_01700, partial [bacterium]|nr:hypothetical protein [bacterium]
AVTPASSPLEISATSNSRYLADVADDLVHLDPRKGGWVGEVINEAVGKRFNELKSFIEAGLTSTDSLSSILSDDFQCHPLRPEELAVGFEDKAVLVRRPAIDLDTVPSTRRGVDGFLLSLDEMLNVDGKSLRGLGTGSEIKAYFKIVGVEADRTSSQTRVLFELDLANSEGRSQQNATWICVWHPARERGGFPLLAEIRVVEYEEIFSPTTKGPLFVDSESICSNRSRGNLPTMKPTTPPSAARTAAPISNTLPRIKGTSTTRICSRNRDSRVPSNQCSSSSRLRASESARLNLSAS